MKRADIHVGDTLAFSARVTEWERNAIPVKVLDTGDWHEERRPRRGYRKSPWVATLDDGTTVTVPGNVAKASGARKPNAVIVQRVNDDGTPGWIGAARYAQLRMGWDAAQEHIAGWNAARDAAYQATAKARDERRAAFYAARKALGVGSALLDDWDGRDTVTLPLRDFLALAPASTRATSRDWLTVGELIERLRRVPADLPVVMSEEHAGLGAAHLVMAAERVMFGQSPAAPSIWTDVDVDTFDDGTPTDAVRAVALVPMESTWPLTGHLDPEVVEQLQAHRRASTVPCCDTHKADGCCDEDCSPCCPWCPTCPSGRAADPDASVTPMEADYFLRLDAQREARGEDVEALEAWDWNTYPQGPPAATETEEVAP